MMLSLSVMVCANVAANRLPAASVLIGVGLTLVLAGIARAGRLSASDLGLARATWSTGVHWGGSARRRWRPATVSRC